MWRLQSRWGETDKNDERRLGHLSGFVRLKTEEEDGNLVEKNSMNTHAEIQTQQLFWWNGVWIRLNRELRFVSVIRKSY